MKKEQKSRVVKELPLRFPYADYEFPRTLPVSDAYLLATDLLDDEVCEQMGAPEGYLAPLQVAVWQASAFFNQTIAINGDAYNKVAKRINVHKSLLSKVANKERPLSLLPDTIATIAHEYMGCSAHYLMFGEECTLRLPNLLASLAEELEKLDSASISELVSRAESAVARSERKYPETFEGGLHRVYAQLSRERLNQILYSNATAALYMLGETLSPRLKNILRIFFSETVNPKTQVVMYVAWAMKDWPLDYYICEHPLRYCDCWYRTDSGEQHIVTDRGIVKILDTCMALDDQDRAEFMAECYKAVFTRMLK